MRHESIPQAEPANALTVDVEDYFHVLAFEPVIERARWSDFELRAERNVDRLLALFAERGVRATFFMLGCVAERAPRLARRIAEAGHEVASHGYLHERVTELNPDRFRTDVRRTKRLLEDQSGQAVRGYRAPSFSINGSNLWAHAILAEEGYGYSSSIFPGSHDIYGMPDAPRFAFRPREDGVIEFPVTTVELGSHRVSCGGGGFFRALPYALFRQAVRHVNRTERQSAIFYMHPWEIDPAQPRVAGASLRSRFRHYLNLSRTEPRLRRLLADFCWGRMDDVFGLGSA